MNLIDMVVFGFVLIDGEMANHLPAIIIALCLIVFGIMSGSYIVIKRYRKNKI
ncbi:MAG: hypothetical protein GKS07_10405 [Nitrosopumilus sp.]|nr:MAG: hypothetical protein GKS07_10405 [Nitrosopumilus sp.]